MERFDFTYKENPRNVTLYLIQISIFLVTLQVRKKIPYSATFSHRSQFLSFLILKIFLKSTALWTVQMSRSIFKQHISNSTMGLKFAFFDFQCEHHLSQSYCLRNILMKCLCYVAPKRGRFSKFKNLKTKVYVEKSPNMNPNNMHIA